ncbi:sensor histidine kinase [Methylomonas sp. UP202]|uniref:sensor histidine kinase n=1 Tax=Methylomonas sp. UP202 TaxID=3040943 RepID=UPI002478679C|nr:sensor histidine kinase [Methylomonas sp. UP202]WGS88195.1 sensor histidine kinase [Methylomonas sp. UP202]
MISLRLRLNRGLAAILCVIFALHWLAADWVIRSVAEKQMLTRLTHDSDSILDTLDFDADGQPSFDTSHAGSVYGQAYSGHYFVLHIDGKPIYSRSLAGTALPFEAMAVDTTRQFHFKSGPHDQLLLVLSRGFAKAGHTISISTAEDLTDIGRDITAIRIGYLALSLTVLVAAIALQTADVKRSLRPLRAVTGELAAIAHGQQRQIEAEVPFEIRPLVKEVNRLLMLVELRLHQSRTAIGNLAHALKTPLAMLFRLAENPALRDLPELKRQLEQQNQTILKRIDRELKRARISGNAQPGATFNPHVELSALCELMQVIYAEKALSFEIRAPDQLLHLDREDMLEMIGNLLDNACKWAKSRIVIDVAEREGLTLRIGDDGPGCDKQQLRQMVQRGLRLDEATPGHGLGLAIVHDIAGYYGGSLALSRSAELGGLAATVRLPPT